MSTSRPPAPTSSSSQRTRRTPATTSSTSGRSSCSCGTAGCSRRSIFLVPTGQALVSEGIAETGADLLLDEAGRAEVQALLAGARRRLRRRGGTRARRRASRRCARRPRCGPDDPRGRQADRARRRRTSSVGACARPSRPRTRSASSPIPPGVRTRSPIPPAVNSAVATSAAIRRAFGGC